MRVARVIEWTGVSLIAAALTVLLTWPLTPRLARVGRLDTGDGQFSIWNIAWVARALVTSPHIVFDANIFFPHENTLAYSEANLVAGALAAPVWALTRNPLAAHNTVVLIAFAAAMIGAYALARAITGDRAASLFSGIAYAFCPFMFARIPHIQLLMLGGLPLVLLAMHRLVDRPTAGRAAVLGLMLATQALACAYYGVFGGLTVGLGVLYFAIARGAWRSPKYWSLVVLAAVVSVAIVLPFFIPYIEIQRELGFSRTLKDARMYSADLQAWLASAAWAHRWMLPLLGSWNEVLFPGFLLTGFGLAGAVLALRGRLDPRGASPDLTETRSRPRETAGFYVLLLLVVFWVSFGPAAGLYTALYYTIPVFSFLRAPGRIAPMAVLALAVLGAMAIAHLRAQSPRARRPVAILVLLVALVAELAAVPLDFREAPPVNPAYRMLARLPRGAVAEFPFFYNRPEFPRHALYMYNSTAHWQPLVNGYSDHIPEDFRRMVLSVSTFPSRAAFARLQDRQTRYVVFHVNMYDRRSREKLMAQIDRYKQHLRPLSQVDDVWLYEIVSWPPRPGERRQ